MSLSRLLPAAVVIISVGYLLRRRASQKNNPFTKDARRPPPQLPKDAEGWEKFLKEKNKIIKDSYRPDKVPNDLDAIVIGSGAGGLTAAVLLARVGKKVLVLEQHDQAGGCCHSFSDQGYEFDPGIHYCGGFDAKSPSTGGFFFYQITEGQVVWHPCEKFYDVAVLHKEGQAEPLCIPMPSGLEDWKDNLKKYFPGEAAVIDKFMEYCAIGREQSLGIMILKVIPRWLARIIIKVPFIRRYLSLFKGDNTTLEVLDELTSNKELQTFLTYHWGDYGTPPSKSAFWMSATLSTHFLNGGFYPVGGPSMIPWAIIPQIKAAGGAVLVNARVSRLVTEGKRVVGVEMAKDGVQIFAPWVISDAGIPNTIHKLLPAELHPIALSNVSYVEPSPAYMSIFIGFRKTAKELGIRPTHYWIMYGVMGHDITSSMSGSVHDAIQKGVPYIFVTFPSSKDPTAEIRNPDRATCSLIFFASEQWFLQWQAEPCTRRSQEYNDLKQALGRKVWDQVCTVPELRHLKDQVDYFNVGTPETNEHYLESRVIYGLDHTKERFQPEVMLELRPDIGIPGLALTGQDVFVCGLTGAMVGGLLTASQILGRNLYDDLSALRKSVQS